MKCNNCGNYKEKLGVDIFHDGLEEFYCKECWIMGYRVCPIHGKTIIHLDGAIVCRTCYYDEDGNV